MKKIILTILVICISLFTFVVLFSSYETRFECVGKLEQKNYSSDVTLYMKITEYRWWVHLWGDGDGMVNIEVPGKYLDLFHHVKKVGDQYQIWKSKDNLIGGYYSSLSNHVDLITYFGNFEGKCKKLD